MGTPLPKPIQYLENVYGSAEAIKHLGRYRSTLEDAVDLYINNEPEKMRKLREVVLFTLELETAIVTEQRVNNIKEVVGIIDMFIEDLEEQSKPNRSHLKLVK